MRANVTHVAQWDIKFATSKRMLVRVMKLLQVTPAKLGQFHEPHSKGGKWVWMLISSNNDPKRKIPIYFSVDQNTLNSHLSVTRKNREEIVTWDLELPTDLKNISADEILCELGF